MTYRAVEPDLPPARDVRFDDPLSPQAMLVGGKPDLLHNDIGGRRLFRWSVPIIDPVIFVSA